MPFLLLLILTAPCLQETWPEPGLGLNAPARIIALTWTAVAAVVLLAVLWAWLVCRSLAHAPGGREAWVQRYGPWRLYHLIVLAATYGVSLYVFGWGWAVQRLCAPVSPLPPGAEVLILAPFLAGLFFSWFCFYEIERVLHDTGGRGASGTGRFWTRRQYLGYQVRHNLALVLLPLTLLIALKALRWLVPASPQGGWAQVITGLGVVGAAALFVGMPWILRLVLGLKPLPDGPLRQRLLAAARRLEFRCSDVLLWDTRGGVANALVAGIFPVLRYVVLTDRLIADLAPEEVEAVFGHEVGHIKHRHMFYYLGFLLVSMSAVWALVAVYVQPHFDALSFLRSRDDLVLLLVVAVLGVYIFVVFGFVSRNCERQADIFGCRAVSCARGDCPGHDATEALVPGGRSLCPTGIRTFIGALEKVADLNGISRDRPGWLQSWQHSTIARRVSFLQRVIVDPQVERRFQRLTLVVKSLLLLSLVAVVVVLGALYGWDKLQL